MEAQIWNGYTDIRHDRFTVAIQPGGTECMVMAKLNCGLGTPEVAAYAGGAAGITNRYGTVESPVGVSGRDVYLLTIVHLVMDPEGLWGHLALVDMARDRTATIRPPADGVPSVWPYDEAADRACDVINRHENGLLDALLQTQNRLMDDLPAEGVSAAASDGAPDGYAGAVASLARLDRLPQRYEGTGQSDAVARARRTTRADRRRLKRRGR